MEVFVHQYARAFFGFPLDEAIVGMVVVSNVVALLIRLWAASAHSKENSHLYDCMVAHMGLDHQLPLDDEVGHGYSSHGI